MNEEALYQQMLDSQVRSLLEVTRGGGGRWPMPVFKNSTTISFYSSPYIISKFMELTDKALGEGKSFEEIGRRYQHPSRLARLMHLFPARSLWDIPQPRHIEVGYRLASILYTMYEKYPFVEDDHNIIYSDSGLHQKFLVDSDFTEFSTSDIKSLSAHLWLLAEAFFPRFQNTFFEFSGPYRVADEWLLVKEYHNLKPTYLPVTFHYPFENITIIEVYGEPVEFRYDIMNRSKTLSSVTPHHYHVVADGQTLKDSNLLTTFTQQVTQTLKEAIAHLSSFKDRDSMAIFSAKAEIYSLLYPLIGEDAFELMKDIEHGLNDPETIKRRDEEIAKLDFMPKDEAGWRNFMDLKVERH